MGRHILMLSMVTVAFPLGHRMVFTFPERFLHNIGSGIVGCYPVICSSFPLSYIALSNLEPLVLSLSRDQTLPSRFNK